MAKRYPHQMAKKNCHLEITISNDNSYIIVEETPSDDFIFRSQMSNIICTYLKADFVCLLRCHSHSHITGLVAFYITLPYLN